MAEAQAEMQPVARTAQNKHLGNKYAKLETIDDALRPIYTRHGFSVRFGSAPGPGEGWLRIVCTVAHSEGYWEENHLDSPLSTQGAQGGRMAVTPVQAIGSTVTYLRRYLLLMVFNVSLADEDDDGEGQRAAPQRREPAPPRPVDPAAAKIAFLGKLKAALDECHTDDAVGIVLSRPTVLSWTNGDDEDMKREINALAGDALDRVTGIDTAGRETPVDGG